MVDAQTLINQVQAIERHFDQMQWWSPEKILQYQLQKIDHLLQFAARTVPFYRNSLSKFDSIIKGPLTLAEFQKIPILTRTDIQQHGSNLITTNLPQGHGNMFDVATSGSTGHPIKVKGTSFTGIHLHAFTLRGHIWHKRDFKAKNVIIKSMKDKKLIKRYGSWAIGQETGPAIEIDVTLPLNRLFDMVIEIDPEYLHVHPTTLRGMIKLSIEQSIKLEALREVRTQGEVADDDLRELCMQKWNVPIVDMYSTEEFNTITHQCPDHQYGHVLADNVLVEILNEDGTPCKPGEVGRVVVTSLTNYATPLIRCDLKDYAEVGEQCSCGRGLLVLKRIVGRSRNMITLPSGEEFCPIFSTGTTLADLPIIQHRLVQTGLNDIVIKLVVERELSDDEKKQLRDYFSHSFNHTFNFPIVYVDELPRGANGKYEFFISEIRDDSNGI